MAEGGPHRVVRLGHQGDGVIETQSGLFHVPGALPGEAVNLSGKPPVRVGAPSPERRAGWLCPHAPRCGGCALQHMSDGLYLRWKQTLLPAALAAQGIEVACEPMIRVPLRSRRRAVLTARRRHADIELGFHVARSHRLETVVECAILAPAIVQGLPVLRELAGLLLAPGGELRIAVLATPRGLDVSLEGLAAKMGAATRTAIARAASDRPIARLCADGELLLTRSSPALTIAGVEVIPPPGAFVQAVEEAEAAMIAIAARAMAKARRAADLFAGLGAFALALARTARILAVDADRGLVEALETAARRAQGLKPIETRVRDLLRDPLSPRELDGFDAVLFDPPRAGARAQAEALARSRVATVVAVSCNPATLARDVRVLLDGGFRLEAVTPVDQFLYTAHLEAVAVLRR